MAVSRRDCGEPVHVEVRCARGYRVDRKSWTIVSNPVGDSWAVFATHGGSPHHPARYRNLMANPRTTVEAGAETVPAVARLAEGAERERIWAQQIALVPKFAEFEAAAGRRIPVVVLQRVQGNEAHT
ncbi:nitroreductase/quinone reductase family protein [Nocardia albiluteola]|uniref:nitroreductase/quinone reductase family protein n=1 Tax=Nocardia albiluteola TaxID=2842303 RepID=UPI0027E02662|nr:nitroreductase/quinone reductase family protein [Nocardia albiluteola]